MFLLAISKNSVDTLYGAADAVGDGMIRILLLGQYVTFSFCISPEGLPRKIPTFFLISPNLRFPQKLQHRCFTYHSGVFDLLSLHPVFSENFFTLWPKSLSSSKHLMSLSLVTRPIVFNPLIFYFLLPTLSHFSCLSILSSVCLYFVTICFRYNFTFPQLCSLDNLLDIMYE